MGKISYAVAGLLVIAVAGGAGAVAAIHYNETRAVVQAEKDKQEAAKMAAIQEREAKETAAREKARRKQELLDQRLGRSEEPDQVIRGLIADMKVTQEADGSTTYRYEDPEEDGIFFQPYLVRGTDGVAVMHVILRHRGGRPMGFQGVDLQPTDDQLFHIRAQGAVTTTQTDTGIMEWCDQPVDAETGKAMREVASVLAAKISMLGVNGSNDDRMLTATEAMRIRNILELADRLNGKIK
ncbi:MAG: hypothetical protein PUB49_06010 [Selenomonadaceae bacterium]|nr:hypothetical protein [Selenomonadaceae bacterium]